MFSQIFSLIVSLIFSLIFSLIVSLNFTQILFADLLDVCESRLIEFDRFFCT